MIRRDYMKKFIVVWKKVSYIMLLAFIVGGFFDVRLALAAVVCMISPIIFALLNKGRYWCGNLCPRGNFFDKIIKKISGKRPMPRFLKSIWFRTLVTLSMFMIFGLNMYINWGDLSSIALNLYRLIVITTLIGIVLALRYSHRTWCSFCPMGSTASYIIYRKKKVRI